VWWLNHGFTLDRSASSIDHTRWAMLPYCFFVGCMDHPPQGVLAFGFSPVYSVHHLGIQEGKAISTDMDIVAERLRETCNATPYMDYTWNNASHFGERQGPGGSISPSYLNLFLLRQPPRFTLPNYLVLFVPPQWKTLQPPSLFGIFKGCFQSTHGRNKCADSPVTAPQALTPNVTLTPRNTLLSHVGSCGCREEQEIQIDTRPWRLANIGPWDLG
jgi:hypothetical protein